MSDEESLSVVMPVYNALPHLDGAIRSILDQTHRNYEFVIYDDASTDGSTERLRQWARDDSRIRLFEGKRNLGPVGSSAFIVEHSTGPLVARMDADDLCAPDRLERQLEVLRNYPCAGLVGTLFDVINDRGQKIRGPDLWRLTRKAPFVPFAAHGSILFRRSVFDQVAGYRAECEYWEDQDLVTRMAAVTAVMVIPSALYQVRQWTKSTRATSDRERVENAVDLMYRAVGRLEQGRSYDDLLQARDQPAQSRSAGLHFRRVDRAVVRRPPTFVRPPAQARPAALRHANAQCCGVDRMGHPKSGFPARLHGSSSAREKPALQRDRRGFGADALVSAGARNQALAPSPAPSGCAAKEVGPAARSEHNHRWKEHRQHDVPGAFTILHRGLGPMFDPQVHGLIPKDEREDPKPRPPRCHWPAHDQCHHQPEQHAHDDMKRVMIDAHRMLDEQLPLVPRYHCRREGAPQLVQRPSPTSAQRGVWATGPIARGPPAPGGR